MNENYINNLLNSISKKYDIEKNELELFSTIKNKDIKVEVLERNCA